MSSIMNRHALAQSMQWTTEEMTERTESPRAPPYVVSVDRQEEALELASVVKELRGVNGNLINPTSFPLSPSIRSKLEQSRDTLFHGRGFVVVRLGPDLKNYRDSELVTLFLGVASYIGDEIGVQDKAGTALTHVTSAQQWSSVPVELRHGIHTQSALSWHTDMGCDILALHVRGQAKSGGQTYIASSFAIYQDLLMSYPDCLDVLTAAQWPIQITASPPRHILAPLVQVCDGKVWMSVDPGRLGLHPVTAKSGIKTDIPELTAQQLEALDVLTSLATKHRLCLETQPGDIVFISNWTHLHARDKFEDPSEGPRRHLVRLWLRNSKLSWTVPKSMAVPWEAAYRNELVYRRFPAHPARKYRPARYTAGSAAFMIEDTDDVNCEAAGSEAISG